MCIGAEISIRTLINRVRIVKTEVFLIFLVAVVFLDKGMSVNTIFSFRAFLFFLDVLTHLRCIKVTKAFPIFSVVIIYTVLLVVVFGNVARMYLKVI